MHVVPAPAATEAGDVRADRVNGRFSPRRPAAEMLLPGEVPDTDVREDAAHWVAVYEELAGFLLAADGPPAVLERYRRRLEHWRRRVEQLAARAEPGSRPGEVPR